ncbi:RNA polymerase sigma factor [Kerstersia gyiorum]|nr:RNA polymerase sigma factor [Kerstersia gyiorum]KAB0544903.1 RNA polymerase sigma factor [Kerstersia gyiorum]
MGGSSISSSSLKSVTCHGAINLMVDVVLRYYQELRRFLLRQGEDVHTVDDIAQESITRILHASQAGTEVRNPRGLLYQVARNLLADASRRRQIRAEEPLENWQADDLQASETQQEEPAAILERKRAAEIYVNTIRSLPPRCQEAFRMHLYDGLSNDEIAQRMGISSSMVKKHILRAMMACKACRDQHEP